MPFVLSERLVTAPAESRLVMLGQSWGGGMSFSWPFKGPSEILDYDIDWTWRLYSASELALAQAQQDAGEPVTITPADTIATSQFTLPAGITATQSANTTTATKVWLSGGTIGQVYLVQNEIVSAGGRTMDQTVKLKIKTK
jgi:hypothetical protein